MTALIFYPQTTDGHSAAGSYCSTPIGGIWYPYSSDDQVQVKRLWKLFQSQSASNAISSDISDKAHARGCYILLRYSILISLGKSSHSPASEHFHPSQLPHNLRITNSRIYPLFLQVCTTPPQDTIWSWWQPPHSWIPHKHPAVQISWLLPAMSSTGWNRVFPYPHTVFSGSE